MNDRMLLDHDGQAKKIELVLQLLLLPLISIKQSLKKKSVTKIQSGIEHTRFLGIN